MSDFPAEVVSQFDSGTMVEEFPASVVSGETLEPGDFAVYDAGNDWVERAGTNPTAIIGISEGFSDQARLLTPNLKVPIRTLSSRALLGLSCATTLVPATHLGVEYGITRSAAGHWQLDVSKTGADARCVVVRIDETTNTAFVRMLEEFLAADGVDS